MTGDGIDAHRKLIALVHKLHIVFRHRHAQSQQPALRQPHDGQILIVRVRSSLDQRARIP